MKILKSDSVLQIKNRFQEEYPNLKIEFYSKSHEEFKGSKKREQLEDSILLSELTKDLLEVEFNIEKDWKVSKLESFFENALHLHVQVFRRSGDVWLQTSKTDDWTMQEQEERARV